MVLTVFRHLRLPVQDVLLAVRHVVGGGIGHVHVGLHGQILLVDGTVYGRRKDVLMEDYEVLDELIDKSLVLDLK